MVSRPDYKDSGLEWLGVVPDHWSLKKIKYLFWERKENNKPIQSENLISLTIEKGVIPHSEKTGGGNKPKEDLTKYKLVYPGDLVINSMNVIAGAVGISQYFGVVSPVYYMLIPQDKQSCPYYFHHMFRTESFQKSLYGLGNGILIKENEETGKLNTIRMRIPMDKLGDQVLPVPPPEEQKLISRYLDKKTEQIDSLIEKIQKKIELLKEQRTSLINQCVTKGLDPNVEMKDSGVEWIGEIPSHWNLRKLTRFCDRVRNGYVGPTRDIMFETGITYLQGIHTDKTGTITFTPNGPFYVSPDWSEKHKETILRTDDIVVVQTGTIGNLGYVTEEFDGSNCHAMIIVSTDKTICYGRYLMYSFLSSYVQNFLQSIKTGEILHHINTKKLRLLNVLLPPLDQQREIVGHLDRETYLIDRLLEKEGQRIGLLKEYRQSLISSVVTGKVRVTEDMI